MSSDVQSLLGRLNPVCRRALEMGAGLCVSRKHFTVEIEHILLALLDLPGSDMETLLEHFRVDINAVRGQLNKKLSTLDTGNRRTPTLAPGIETLLERAWLFSTLHLGQISIRSASLLVAAVTEPTLRAQLATAVPSLTALPAELNDEQIRQALGDSAESDESLLPPPEAPPDLAASSATSDAAAALPESFLGRYTIDLVAEARSGNLDPVYEREDEIRQVIDILTRRRQNNPILVGDAGVGKTAIAEGFALRVAVGDVPEGLREISLRVLDLGMLEAGAGVKGEFENRLRSVISEVEAADSRIVLFIDEAHNLVGAGGSQGRGDAANLLKPALASGRLRTIAATTWSEYKRHFEKDPALARRFQPVTIEEPDEEAAVSMLRGVVPTLEEHHGIRILDDAVVEAVRLSQRFITDRRLPAKAISVLDTAAARVALAQQSRPVAIERLSKQIRRFDRELESLEKEARTNTGAASRIATLQQSLDSLTAEREELEERWEVERQLVLAIAGQQAEIERLTSSHGDDAPDVEHHSNRIVELEHELAALQRADVLVPAACTARVVAEVVSAWTGIPAGRMLRDEVDILLSLPERISERIVGQPEAIATISRHMQTARAGLEDPHKPKGVFLLAGPSGVGKTETAFVLADLLYGGQRNLVVLNMSEFQESHSVATLKGAPPGYVGFGTGGVLTEAVRRKPYCVLLLDEVEKAHPDVLDIFFHVFDKGILEDGEGISVDFKHTVILLTTNLGGDLVHGLCDRHLPARPTPDSVTEALRPVLTERLGSSLLTRLDIVPYYPLGESQLRQIVRLKLQAVQQRIRRAHSTEFTFEDALVDSLAESCVRSESGARQIDAIINRKLLPELSTKILQRMSDSQAVANVEIFLEPDGDLR